MRVFDRMQAGVVTGTKSETRQKFLVRRLTEAGLLRRFAVPTAAGGRKLLYAISKVGAELANVPNRGPRRAFDQLLIGDHFVTHQLAINEIYCTVKYKPIPTTTIHFVRWQGFFESLGDSVSLIPDGYFELATHQGPVCAFVEVDLGNESRTVWREKVKEYLDYVESRQFESAFGHPQFRVLAIASSAGRRHSIRHAVESQTPRLFWFTDFDLIQQKGFWSEVWTRPERSELRALV